MLEPSAVAVFEDAHVAHNGCRSVIGEFLVPNTPDDPFDLAHEWLAKNGFVMEEPVAKERHATALNGIHLPVPFDFHAHLPKKYFDLRDRLAKCSLIVVLKNDVVHIPHHLAVGEYAFLHLVIDIG